MHQHRAVLAAAVPGGDVPQVPVRAGGAQQVGQGEAVFLRDACRGGNAEAAGVVQQPLDPGRTRHADPHRRPDAAAPEFGEPGKDRVRIEAELRDDGRVQALVLQCRVLVGQHPPQGFAADVRVPLGVAADAHMLDAVVAKQPGADQGQGILEGAQRLRRVAGHGEHVPGRCLRGQRVEELLQFLPGGQAPGGDMRNRDEAQPPDRCRRRDPHPQVLVAQEGDIDARSRRDERGGLLQGGNVLARHFQREVVKQRSDGARGGGHAVSLP